VGDYTENLSSGGTFIHTTRAFELGTTIQLVLSFPGLLDPVALEGIVRWARGGDQPGIGVEFVPGPWLERLDALIVQLRSGEGAPVGRVVRVLVADDNTHVAELICNGLKTSAKRLFGDTVAFVFARADNGASALDLVKHEPFDCAIIDVYMPVRDGAQVIEDMRGELGLAEMPIIAVSGGGDGAESRALAAGANVYLEKPVRLRSVIDSMRQLVKACA
jgi:CheY-like chemotaxis protein